MFPPPAAERAADVPKPSLRCLVVWGWDGNSVLQELSWVCRFSGSKLPYDVTPEQALAHDEVKTRLDTSIKNMRTVTDKFLLAIVSSLEKIP